MNNIFILVFLTIFAARNIAGDNGVWFRTKRINDKNNLFYSLVYVLIGPAELCSETDYIAHMRKQASDVLYAHSDYFATDPRLHGRPVNEYADDLLQADSYGGELELDILSRLYKTEIVVCDWTTRSIRTYEGGEGTAARVFLLYTSNNHYDTLGKSMVDLKTPININGVLTTFPINDDSHLADALALAQDPEYFDKLDASAGTSTIGPGKKRRY